MEIKIPIIEGIPKLHKDGIPLRPIVKSRFAPTNKVAKFVARKLKIYVGKTSSYVRDSFHFVDLIKDMTVNEGDFLVRFDVISRFSSIPTQEVIDMVGDLKNGDKVIRELPNVILKNNYFRFKDKFYEQTEGLAMGSPLSPILANLYVEKYEMAATESANLKPKCWLCR